MIRGLGTARNAHKGDVRRPVLRAIAVGWVICLALLVIPLQIETRIVGLGGLVLFTAMYVGERLRPRSPRPGQRRGAPALPFLVHGAPRR